jgi:hypothetical protein
VISVLKRIVKSDPFIVVACIVLLAMTFSLALQTVNRATPASSYNLYDGPVTGEGKMYPPTTVAPPPTTANPWLTGECPTAENVYDERCPNNISPPETFAPPATLPNSAPPPSNEEVCSIPANQDSEFCIFTYGPDGKP